MIDISKTSRCGIQRYWIFEVNIYRLRAFLQFSLAVCILIVSFNLLFNSLYFPDYLPAFSKISASLVKDDYEHCKNTVNKWASSSPDLEVKEEKHRLRDLLFFLHVPRTGGRTYFHW